MCDESLSSSDGKFTHSHDSVLTSFLIYLHKHKLFDNLKFCDWASNK